MPRAYLFEAKGIQRWVLAGDKLRDIAAASALLARLAGDPADDVLGKVLIAAKFEAETSRRAGGAFMLHFGDGAAEAAAFGRFRALWRLTFMRLAPGLEFSEAEGGGTDGGAASKAAYRPSARMAAARDNGPSGLIPLAHPLAVLARRTGLPAVARGGPHDPDDQGIDAAMLAKRRAARVVTDRAAKILGGKLVKDRETAGLETLEWPNRMEDDGRAGGVTFPFEGAEARIAVIHADISALGKFYDDVGVAAAGAGKPLEVARAASAAIEAAVGEAAALAARDTLAPVGRVMPARPVLIGGDDVTVIVRGDRAIDFANAFLRRLECASGRRLSEFAGENGLNKALGEPLTAAAGIAVGGPKQPFFRLLELAESLCGYAKSKAKAAGEGGRPRSVLAFHRVTESALASGAEDLFARLMTGAGWLTAQPYRTGKAGLGDFPTVEALQALANALDAEGLKPGGLRALRGRLLKAQTALAEEEWRRWRSMAVKRAPNALNGLDAALGELTRGQTDSTLASLFSGTPGATALFDALEWRALR